MTGSDHQEKPAINQDQELSMTLDPAVRRMLDGTPLAHLASVLPDETKSPSSQSSNPSGRR
jgi:hypothetical protein